NARLFGYIRLKIVLKLQQCISLSLLLAVSCASSQHQVRDRRRGIILFVKSSKSDETFRIYNLVQSVDFFIFRQKDLLVYQIYVENILLQANPPWRDPVQLIINKLHLLLPL